jgi:hypothetical protein
VPEIVFVQLDTELARTEPDAEIQDLIRASVGLNLALDYLPGAVAFDPLVHRPDADLASAIVWHDAFVTNVDRTPRNTNLLMWHRKLWLIDHGAALIFHHQWEGYMERSTRAFAAIKDHVLLPFADRIAEADEAMTRCLGEGVVRRIVALVPGHWLEEAPQFRGTAEQRDAYVAYLMARLQPPRAFVEEALRALSVDL